MSTATQAAGERELALRDVAKAHRPFEWERWLLWAFVHIYLLAGFERRLLVATQWLARYLTGQRGARLITRERDEPPPGG